MTLRLSCKCGHSWDYGGKSEYWACCPRCRGQVNVKKAKAKLKEAGDGRK